MADVSLRFMLLNGRTFWEVVINHRHIVYIEIESDESDDEDSVSKAKKRFIDLCRITLNV